MNTQTKVGVGVRLRLGLRFIISKKKGDVNMNMQTKVGVGVRLRLGLGFIKADPYPNLTLDPTPTLVCVHVHIVFLFFNILFQFMIFESQIERR